MSNETKQVALETEIAETEIVVVETEIVEEVEEVEETSETETVEVVVTSETVMAELLPTRNVDEIVADYDKLNSVVEVFGKPSVDALDAVKKLTFATVDVSVCGALLFAASRGNLSFGQINAQCLKVFTDGNEGKFKSKAAAKRWREDVFGESQRISGELRGLRSDVLKKIGCEYSHSKARKTTGGLLTVEDVYKQTRAKKENADQKALRLQREFIAQLKKEQQEVIEKAATKAVEAATKDLAEENAKLKAILASKGLTV